MSDYPDLKFQELLSDFFNQLVFNIKDEFFGTLENLKYQIVNLPDRFRQLQKDVITEFKEAQQYIGTEMIGEIKDVGTDLVYNFKDQLTDLIGTSKNLTSNLGRNYKNYTSEELERFGVTLDLDLSGNIQNVKDTIDDAVTFYDTITNYKQIIIDLVTERIQAIEDIVVGMKDDVVDLQQNFVDTL